MDASTFHTSLPRGLIVSCQAPAGHPFAAPELLARFARSAVDGGAVAIRAEGPEAIRAIRQAVGVPIVGIRKRTLADGRILITPAHEDARELVAAGADIVALDCTRRGQAHDALARLRRIRAELGVPAWADIATLDEAVAAASAGADAVLSTLRGYTDDTRDVAAFEPGFIADLVRAVRVPVIAEGRVGTPDEAATAVRAGATAVVVGTAITRPEEITRLFAARMAEAGATPATVVGVDLGGTNLKSAYATADHTLRAATVTPTPAAAGRDAVLAALLGAARDRLADARRDGASPTVVGVSTAGWVDPHAGRIVHATDTIPNWTGTEIARALEDALGLPVAVENDGNAFALAEQAFGAGRTASHFVCLTFGTGVGGGCVIDGRLNHGAHFLANGIGHIVVERNGRPCACGRRGCLEAYASAEALVGFGGGRWTNATDLIAAAGTGDAAARQALETHADWVAAGCVTLLNLLDPERIVVSGGLAENNPVLVPRLEGQLGLGRAGEPHAKTRVVKSGLGYFGGVRGAIALARNRAKRA